VGHSEGLMENRKMSLLLLSALFFLCVISSQAGAQPFVLSKVVDLNTPIPGGSGNFTVFSYSFPLPYMVSGGNVAFQAGGGSGQYGIYIFNGTTVTRVADYNSPIPGGSGNFIVLLSGNPVISDNNVAFWGGGSAQDGIYLFHGTTLSKVADTNTPTPGGSGNFTGFFDPVIDDGKVVFRATGAGQNGFYLATSQTHPADFDGDRKSDITIWRPEDGFWYTIGSKDGSIISQQWGSGALNDLSVAGDYDGDGKTDCAVWRPEDYAYWYILKSSNGGVIAEQWGSSMLNDVPVPGDYDGDGKADMAVWRPGNGYWYIVSSKDGSITATQWGAGSLDDKPISR
jgi:hypothetical protein